MGRTNAAVTGALLGCRHSVGAVPERWLGALRARRRIERAAAGLVAAHRGTQAT